MSKNFQKDKVSTIAFGHFAHDIYSSFLAPMLPLLVEKIGLSLSQAGSLDIARRLPSLFNPLFGLMAENRGAKYFVILTPAITAISMGLIGFATSYPMLVFLLFVAGVSAAFFHIPSPVMIKEASGEKIGKGMGYFMVGGESARTIGPLIITFAISLWGLEGSLRVVPFGILASILLYFKLKDMSAYETKKKILQKGDLKNFLSKYGRFFIFMGTFIFFQSAIKSSLVLYLPIFLVKNGTSLVQAGISLSVLQFFGIAGTMFAGSYSDKIGRVVMLNIAMFLTTLFMFVFIFFHSNFLFPLLAFIGFFLFSTGPVLMAMVQDLKSDMPTFANSMYMSINFGVSSLMVFLLGYLGDNLGLNRTYEIASFLGIVCILILLLLNTELKRVIKS